MPIVVLPSGEERQVVRENAVSDVLAMLAPKDGGKYELLFLGRRLAHEVRLADVQHLKETHRVRLVKKGQCYEELMPKWSANEVEKQRAWCQQALAELIHGDLPDSKKLDAYFSDPGTFKSMVDKEAAFRYDFVGLNAISDPKLLCYLLFKDEKFAYEHPHCLAALKTALSTLSPSFSRAGPSRLGQVAGQPVRGHVVTQQMLQNALAAAMQGLPAPQNPVVPPGPAPALPPQQPAANELSDHQIHQQQFATQLHQMREFGFTNEGENLQALIVANGDVEAALSLVISMREKE